MTHLDLCTGIGGFHLAARGGGFMTSDAKLVSNRRNLEKARAVQMAKRIRIICLNCGRELWIPRCWEGRKHYCSNNCRYAHKLGSAAPNWRGGIDRSLRPNSGENLKWRRAVIKRAEGHCEYCFRKAQLVAHHRMRYAYFPALRYEVNNGEALCEDCHRRIHAPELNFRGAQTRFPFA